MTRKRIIVTNKLLTEYLESSEEVFCVITKDVLEAVIQDSAGAYNETRRLIQESNDKYSASLDALTNTIKDTLDTHHRDSQASSIDATKAKPSSNQSLQEINIENQFKIRKDVTSRIVRAERLSTYYQELLAMDPPFVRHEFRTKVNKNTSETSLAHRRKQTIDNVQVEINIMKDNIKNWTEKRNKMDEKLQEHLSVHPEEEVEVNERMQKKKAFFKSQIVVGSRQPSSLRNILVIPKCSTKTNEEKWKKPSGLFTCNRCINHHKGYVKRCTFFKFGKKGKFSWNYTRFFNCDSENVIYILICRTCWKFYIGETKKLKPRTRKHRSDVLLPQNTFCKKLSAHLRKCSKMKGPYFNIYPVFYVADQARRRFIEKRFIARFRPPLNGDS